MDFSENRFSIKKVEKQESTEMSTEDDSSSDPSFKKATRDMRGSVVMKRRKTVD
jgi:hypothetical protein